MSRIVGWVGWCALSVTSFSAVAQAEPRKPTHVACVGDSITAGSGASSPSKNYVSLLQGLLGGAVQVKNFGKSGATMLSEGFGDKPYELQVEYTNATDFVSNAGAGAVVSVVIILGANDSKPYNWDPASGKNDQQYLADYRALVDHFAGLPTKPVVYVGYPLATGTNPCCSIRGDVIHDEQLPLIRQVATEKHLPIIDLNTATTNHPEYFGDGVHPNDAGYAVMAELVKKGLEREPTVSITSPSFGAMPSAASPLALTVEAAADTVDIGSVEFFEGVRSLGKATTKPFTLSWAAPVGAHVITAKATDTTLASATSSAVSFTVVAADASGAGGGGAAGGGAAGAGAGGGASTAGTGMAGTSGTSGVVGGAASSGGSAGASAGVTAAVAPETESSCACSAPGSGRAGARPWLLAVALLG